MPLHDGERIVRQGSGEYIDVGKNRADRAGHDRGTRRGRAYRVDSPGLGDSAGTSRPAKKAFPASAPTIPCVIVSMRLIAEDFVK